VLVRGGVRIRNSAVRGLRDTFDKRGAPSSKGGNGLPKEKAFKRGADCSRHKGKTSLQREGRSNGRKRVQGRGLTK